MNSTFLRILAVVLAIGALVMAWSGYRMSTKAAAPATAPAPPPTYPQVVALREIPAGVLLKEEDVQVLPMPQRDPHGFDSAADAAGKLVIEPIHQGRPVLASHFARMSPAAEALQPGERGVAVKVNEVIGAGGYLNPGDHVDVLVYLRGDRETANTSSAQMVLRNLRVLAFGDQLNGHGEGEAEPSMLDAAAPKDEGKKDEKKANKEVKSALLAVPEKDVTRLMLADSSGTLRLALRGAEPLQAETAEQAQGYFLQLGQLAHAGTAITPVMQVAQSKPGVPAKSRVQKASRPREEKPSVIVHQGDKVEVVRVAH